MSTRYRNLKPAESPSPPSTSSSQEEEPEEWNMRLTPYWPRYRTSLQSRGFRLDTAGDVRKCYRDWGVDPPQALRRRQLADDDLCPDAGLPDNLFRGTSIRDGAKVVIKAVHLRSRELEIIQFLSTPPIRDHPLNHSIPVLDILRDQQDQIAFIIMEEWSSECMHPDHPCSFETFLTALRQCIEHVLFLHHHRIAHLDISLKNILTDSNGRFAYIDYERSRRFDDPMHDYRGTEIPPECVNGMWNDLHKIDVWALAVLMLRVCKLSGYGSPELLDIIKPMLNENPNERPALDTVLANFDRLQSAAGSRRRRKVP